MVDVPGSAEIVLAVEDDEVLESQPLQLDGGADPAEAGADDDGVELLRSHGRRYLRYCRLSDGSALMSRFGVRRWLRCTSPCGCPAPSLLRGIEHVQLDGVVDQGGRESSPTPGRTCPRTRRCRLAREVARDWGRRTPHRVRLGAGDVGDVGDQAVARDLRQAVADLDIRRGDGAMTEGRVQDDDRRRSRATKQPRDDAEDDEGDLLGVRLRRRSEIPGRLMRVRLRRRRRIAGPGWR